MKPHCTASSFAQPLEMRYNVSYKRGALMSKLYTLIILTILLASCLAKNSNETAGNPPHETGTQEVQTMQETQAAARKPIRTMFVNAPSGLRVRSSPSLQGDVIGVLSDLLEVAMLAAQEYSVNIDGITDRWTLIEADDIQGWVFGGFLSSSPRTRFEVTFAEIPTGVYPTHIEDAGRTAHLVFSDGSRERIIGGHPISWEGDMRNVRVFSTNSRESEYELIARGGSFAFSEIDQIENWLFLANRGFVYIYDLPTDGEIPTESRLLQQFPKFRRYGPLLQVTHNNTIIRFWSRGFDTGSLGIRLENYFEEHEEILLGHYGYESVSFRIYNLRLGAYTDYNGGLPYFNSSRDVAISVENLYDATGYWFIAVYTIDNGIYTKVLAERLAIWQMGEAGWLNDDEFRIGSSSPESGSKVFLIKRNGAGFEFLQEH